MGGEGIPFNNGVKEFATKVGSCINKSISQYKCLLELTYFIIVIINYIHAFICKYSIFLLGVLLVWGCNTTTINPDLKSLGYSYYPLDVGQFLIYDVRVITWSAFGTDTAAYVLKETITGTFQDDAGNMNYVLVREIKPNGNAIFSEDSIWSTYKTEYNAVLNKGGNLVIPIVFPVSNGISWDANSLSARSVDEYEFNDVNVNYTIGDITFANSVKVVQEDKPDSLISFDYRIEIFAEDVGLIEKVDSRLKFCTENECFGNKIIEEGRQYHQKLIAYGSE